MCTLHAILHCWFAFAVDPAVQVSYTVPVGGAGTVHVVTAVPEARGVAAASARTSRGCIVHRGAAGENTQQHMQAALRACQATWVCVTFP